MDRRSFISLMSLAGMGFVPWRAVAKAPDGDGDVVFLRAADPDYGKYRTVFNSRIARAPAVTAVHYANYADGDLAQWAGSYYGETGYKRLQAVKKRLDPDNVFRHPQSIALP